MKTNKTLIFTRIFYVLMALFAIGTICFLWMAYSDIDIDMNSSIALKYGVVGYVFLIFFLLLYIPFLVVLNLRKLEWGEVKGKIFKFIIYFTLFLVLNYTFDYFFRPSKIDLFREAYIAFGTSFGINFMEVIFLEKKR